MSETRAEEWSPPRRQRWSREDGRSMVEALRRGGETVEDFAVRHGLPKDRVRRWLRAATPAGVGVQFVPVTIVPPRASAADGGVDVVVGEMVIRVGRGFDGEVLHGVLAVLRHPC